MYSYKQVLCLLSATGLARLVTISTHRYLQSNVVLQMRCWPLTWEILEVKVVKGSKSLEERRRARVGHRPFYSSDDKRFHFMPIFYEVVVLIQRKVLKILSVLDDF